MTRVLIADNNVELCEILDRYLSSQPDVTVVGTAYDGEQCLAMIAEHQPDVVILDITMPKLDGIAVMERLATLGVQPRPRVIVLTAMGREDIIQRLTALGADYFVVKPFNLDVLVERIRQFGPGGSEYTVVKEESAAAQYPVTVDWESQVTQMLHELGIPPHFKGYAYLRDAVVMVLQDEQLLGGTLTKRLYPALAEKYETSPAGVEAAVRNAIIAGWENGNRELLEQLIGKGRRDRFPTNSMVIAHLADYLRFRAPGARAARAQ
ncbi:MAG: sporulation transcription factor Spo0A [Firmicutes bacterium]|nr:sporulation transcription factor Spo0A [Bacillota bacterium]MBO2519443.1 sporulation transcription factor Spo0A [Bacillota bacterium]